MSAAATSLQDRARVLQPGATTIARQSVAPLILAVALPLVMHFVVGPSVGAYPAKVLLDIGINVILAVSLNLVNGYTGQFSIGHAGFMAVGGYVAGAVTYYGSFRAWGSAAVHGTFLGSGEALYLLATICGALVAGVFGYVVGLPSLRLRGDYLALVTLGFGEILRVMVQQTDDVLFSADEIAATPWPSLMLDVGGALGFGGLPWYTSMFWVWLWVAITVLVAVRLKLSTHGRAFLSIREDEVAAEAMGIPTTRYKVRAFVLSAAFAGVAGALFAHEPGTTLNPAELGFQKSFEVVIMVVLGGMGSVSGCVVAAIVLTVLPELLRSVDEYRMIAYAVALIAMMIVRPQGLFGVREIWELRPFRRKAA